nr:hypothetical protein [Nitrosopumilus sp.]
MSQPNASETEYDDNISLTPSILSSAISENDNVLFAVAANKQVVNFNIRKPVPRGVPLPSSKELRGGKRPLTVVRIDNVKPIELDENNNTPQEDEQDVFVDERDQFVAYEDTKEEEERQPPVEE